MKNTNTNEFRGKVYAYLIASPLDEESEGLGDAERVAYIWERFRREYDYPDNRKRMPSLQDRFASWLSGLPLGIAYTYADIIAQAEAWHECQLSEAQADMVCERWFAFLSLNFLRLARQHGLTD